MTVGEKLWGLTWNGFDRSVSTVPGCSMTTMMGSFRRVNSIARFLETADNVNKTSEDDVNFSANWYDDGVLPASELNRQVLRDCTSACRIRQRMTSDIECPDEAQGR